MFDLKEFEEVVKKLDRNKFHICRVLAFNENGAYLSDWSIFRKDMSTEEYWNKNNLAVLSSAKGNTIEDVKKFVEEICNN